MRFPDLPTGTDPLAPARLQGTVSRLAAGSDRDVPQDQAVAELRTITTDPRVLGHVLGGYVVRQERSESGTWARAVRLLRAAGADEAAAATVAVWQRERRERQGGLLD